MGHLVRPARTPPYRYANFPMMWIGGARICTPDSAVEFILPLCDVTVTPTGTVSITWIIYFSTHAAGAKTATMRLRRSDLNGAVLASQAFGDPGSDSMAGAQQSWSSSYSDTTPTDGRYVMTLVETGAVGSAAKFYTAALAFKVDGR